MRKEINLKEVYQEMVKSGLSEKEADAMEKALKLSLENGEIVVEP